MKHQIEEFRNRWYSYDKEILAHKKVYSDLRDLETNLESSQFAIDLECYHFECLFKEGDGDYLYVSYNGAKLKTVPGFPRWGYHNLYNGSMLCLEDPMYYKSDDISCGSFYGDREKSCIVISLAIIKAVCNKVGVAHDKVIFFSSSQGGYSGTYASTLMPGTLSIGLNPRLYIQDTPHAPNFTKCTGIDMNIPDPLHRNDIVHCIKNGSSRHVMLFNVQCDHDWNHHGVRFCKEFGLTPQYGITTKDNCLFWVYDCVGAPNPHTSFETKSIFMFIDRIAKAFWHGEVTEEMRKVALSVNECWHDIYDLKSMVLRLRKKQNKTDFLYIRGGQMCAGEKVSSLHNITVAKRDIKHNYYRYNILSRNKKISVHISGITGSVDRFTAGVFDFKNDSIMHYEEYETSGNVIMRFATGENIEGLAFCVYAGISGNTQGQELFIKDFEVWEESM